MKKRGISPVVASVVLVAIVIVIGIIIFTSAMLFLGESQTKFDKSMRLACEDVDLDVSADSSNVYVTNNGDVPVWKLRIFVSDGTDYEKSAKLYRGSSGEYSVSDAERVIPILQDDDGEEYICEDNEIEV